MSTKKKISDIDKAIEEMQQRRDECFKHIGKVMYESCLLYTSPSPRD